MHILLYIQLGYGINLSLFRVTASKGVEKAKISSGKNRQIPKLLSKTITNICPAFSMYFEFKTLPA